MNSVNLQLYDHLLRFQLFQGLSRNELMQMAGTTKFGFMKEPPGRTIARADEPCRELLFLVGGQLQLTTRSADGAFSLSEQVAAPWQLQPEALFGHQPRFSGQWVTETVCHFITLSKDEVLRLTDQFLIVRLNLFNMLATQAQKREARQWRRAPQSLQERFIRFLLDHALYPAGAKQLHILMTRLAQELGDSRLLVSRMLNGLQDEQKLQLRRGCIIVPSLEKLINA